MSDDQLAVVFEQERSALTGLAYRLLGSRSSAEDAVQDAWLRLAGTNADAIVNLRGWLRTVVTRLCLDQLRARKARADPSGPSAAPRRSEPVAGGPGPEELVELADVLGRVLLVVLDRLSPAERVAFVVHDMFAVPYNEIAPLIGKSTEATKKLGARARAKVRGQTDLPPGRLNRHSAVVTRFLDAARSGDVERIVTILDPDAVRTADPSAVPSGLPLTARGAREVAAGVAALAERSRQADLALIDGDVGLVVTRNGRIAFAITFTIESDRITRYHVTADPARLDALDIALPPGGADAVAVARRKDEPADRMLEQGGQQDDLERRSGGHDGSFRDWGDR